MPSFRSNPDPLPDGPRDQAAASGRCRCRCFVAVVGVFERQKKTVDSIIDRKLTVNSIIVVVVVCLWLLFFNMFDVCCLLLLLFLFIFYNS